MSLSDKRCLEFVKFSSNAFFMALNLGRAVEFGALFIVLNLERALVGRVLEFRLRLFVATINQTLKFLVIPYNQP